MNDRRGRGIRHFDDFEEHRARRVGRMRRGDIRTALLATLAENPGHGYDLIQALEDKSGGTWRPSPGSVYPTLQLLEDEGLVRSTERGGKRVFEITDAGREEAARRIEEAGGTPWELAGRGMRSAHELRRELAQLHMACKQVAITGNPTQAERTLAIVRDARKAIYQLLAED
jgi:DNA-binding PadR family transcriptional regulator